MKNSTVWVMILALFLITANLQAQLFNEAGNNPSYLQADVGYWDPIGGQPPELNGTVRVIAVGGSDLHVGGDFTDAGGIDNADYIAKWNGSSWDSLGSGLNNTVRAVAISGDDVYVGGEFSLAGGVPASYLARYRYSATNIIKDHSDPVNHFTLLQNVPNPFNATTLIKYKIEKPALTRLMIYNSPGQKVTELVNEYQDAGNFEVRFDASNLSSGIYFLHLKSGDQSGSIKILLIK